MYQIWCRSCFRVRVYGNSNFVAGSESCSFESLASFISRIHIIVLSSPSPAPEPISSLLMEESSSVCCPEPGPVSAFSGVEDDDEGSLAITFSNCDQRASTELNSLPTWRGGGVRVSLVSWEEKGGKRGGGESTYGNHTLQRSIQFIYAW